MNYWDAANLARGGSVIRRAAWATDQLRTGGTVAFSAGAGTTRAVAVWRQSGTEIIVRPMVSASATGTAAGLTPDVLTGTRSMIDGETIIFESLTGGTGLSTGIPYFVRDVSGLTFKLALTSGGTAVNFTTDITASTLRVGHIGSADLLADDWEVAA